MGFGRIFILAAICLLAVAGAAVSAADDLTIEVTDDYITIGDIVPLKGTVSDARARVVYLYLTGGDLPDEGTALIGDIRSGRLPNEERYLAGPTWDYSWDTGLIVGGLDQGTYTIYVSTSNAGVDKLEEGDYASVEVYVNDPSVPTESSPSQVFLLIGALAGIFLLTGLRRTK